MKLQAKYNRAVLIASIVILLFGSLGYYFLIKRLLIHQLDTALAVEEQEIIHHARVAGQLPESTRYKDQRIEYTEINNPVKRQFKSVSIYDPAEHESEITRQLSFPLTIKNHLYNVTVIKSQTETEDLLGGILFTTGAVLLLLLLVLFAANRLYLKRLWKPFYSTVNNLKTFNPGAKKGFTADKTNIEEFKVLNSAVEQMSEKVVHDFNALKAFADNASHEMQTPLAVINSKLDLLIQNENLNEENSINLQGIYDAVNKLTRINQSLLLLAKLDNDQFTGKEPIRIDKLFSEKLYQLEELIQSKSIKVQSEFSELTVDMNPILADILAGNLVSNAIRHNRSAGLIEVKTLNNALIISNSGSGQPLTESNLFQRFQKSGKSEGSGLGLTIVKRICDLNHFLISYQFRSSLHSFELAFN